MTLGIGVGTAPIGRVLTTSLRQPNPALASFVTSVRPNVRQVPARVFDIVLSSLRADCCLWVWHGVGSVYAAKVVVFRWSAEGRAPAEGLVLHRRPPNVGVVSAVPVGNTETASVVRSPLWSWAASSTRTARVLGGVEVAGEGQREGGQAEARAAPDTLEMETLGIAVTSSKLDAVTPLTKLAPSSCSLTVAPFKLPSASGEGVVTWMKAL